MSTRPTWTYALVSFVRVQVVPGASEMWEHFESTCSKLEVQLIKGLRGFGLELAANYVVSLAPDSPAVGKLMVCRHCGSCHCGSRSPKPMLPRGANADALLARDADVTPYVAGE